MLPSKLPQMRLNASGMRSKPVVSHFGGAHIIAQRVAAKHLHQRSVPLGVSTRSRLLSVRSVAEVQVETQQQQKSQGDGLVRASHILNLAVARYLFSRAFNEAKMIM